MLPTFRLSYEDSGIIWEKPHSVQEASSMNGSIRSCSGLLRRIRAVTLSRQKGLRQIRTESISMPFHRESLACGTLRLIVSGSISNSRWLRKTGSWTGVTTGIIQRRKRDIWHLKGLFRGKYHTKSLRRFSPFHFPAMSDKISMYTNCV